MTTTTRATPAAAAFLRYIATHDYPTGGEAIREAMEWMYREGCRDTVRLSAELSQSTQTLQRVLVLLELIKEGD